MQDTTKSITLTFSFHPQGCTDFCLSSDKPLNDDELRVVIETIGQYVDARLRRLATTPSKSAT